MLAPEWDALHNITDSMVVVERGGNYGIMHLSGKVILAAELDKLPEISEKYTLLIHNDKLAWYDLSSLKFIWKEEGY